MDDSAWINQGWPHYGAYTLCSRHTCLTIRFNANSSLETEAIGQKLGLFIADLFNSGVHARDDQGHDVLPVALNGPADSGKSLLAGKIMEEIQRANHGSQRISATDQRGKAKGGYPAWINITSLDEQYQHRVWDLGFSAPADGPPERKGNGIEIRENTVSDREFLPCLAVDMIYPSLGTKERIIDITLVNPDDDMQSRWDEFVLELTQ